MDYKKTLRNRSECFFITSLKTALAPGGRSRGDAARSVFENQSLLAVGVDGDRAVAATLPAEISFRGFIRLICLLLIVFQPEKQDPIIVVIINRRTSMKGYCPVYFFTAGTKAWIWLMETIEKYSLSSFIAKGACQKKRL